jgi:hypothetical protein
MLPAGASIYPSGWIMGLGTRQSLKTGFAHLPWFVGLSALKGVYELSVWITFSKSSGFCSFPQERTRHLNPKHFPNRACKLGSKHFPRRHSRVQSSYFKQKQCLARNHFRTELIPTFTVSTKRILFWPANTSKKAFLAIHGKGVSAPWWKCGKHFHMLFLAGKKVQMSS